MAIQALWCTSHPRLTACPHSLPEMVPSALSLEHIQYFQSSDTGEMKTSETVADLFL